MKVPFNTKSIIGRVVIVLLLAGGLIFAGMFSVNTFVPTPAVASSCCGGAEQGAASDSISSESEGCCAKEGSTIGPAGSCCSHTTCPDDNPDKTCNTCGGSDKDCTCKAQDTNSCPCEKICEEGSYSCDAGPGSCYSGS